MLAVEESAQGTLRVHDARGFNTQGDVTCDFETDTCVLELRGGAGDVCLRTCTTEDGVWSCYGWSVPAAGVESSNTVTNCWTKDGLYCADNGTCQALLEAGGPCGIGDFCVDGAVCNDDFAGVCEVLPGVGESCTFGCESGAYCSPDSVCEAQQPDGAPCDDWNQCLGYCSVNTGLCAAEASRGEVRETECTGELYEDLE